MAKPVLVALSCTSQRRLGSSWVGTRITDSALEYNSAVGYLHISEQKNKLLQVSTFKSFVLTVKIMQYIYFVTTGQFYTVKTGFLDYGITRIIS